MDRIERDSAPLVVARYFHGPPDSGNGGYVAGLLANRLGGPAEITLRAPVPLDRPLAVQPAEDGTLVLLDDDRLIAQARPAPGFTLDVPPAPDWQTALACSARGGSGPDCAFYDCFVCGRSRRHGDGLQVWAARIPARGDRPAMAVSAFTPHANFAGAGGLLAPEYLWGALDCPGADAVLHDGDTRIVLTGRMTGVVERRPRVGENCMVMAWSLGGAGRKFDSGSAVIDAAGRVLARARITWIVVRND
jgi:hypothetical protein